MKTKILVVLFLAALAARASSAQAQSQLDVGFHKMYELKFDDARAEFSNYLHDHPDDPLGQVAIAASYLFEEFNIKGVFTSAFFLDDKKFLGGVDGKPDESRRDQFFQANQRARELAKERLKFNARDVEGLLVVTLASGMEADYDALIAKRQLAGLHMIRESEATAAKLLAVDPNAQDANLALGAANYIIGSMPAYKRAFLWVGGVHGDRQRGMNQLQQAALHGHYLQPFAKVLLALAALREKQPDLARSLFSELHDEFPANQAFAQELAKIPR